MCNKTEIVSILLKSGPNASVAGERIFLWCAVPPVMPRPYVNGTSPLVQFDVPTFDFSADWMHVTCTCASCKLALQGSTTRGSKSHGCLSHPSWEKGKTGLAPSMLNSWIQGVNPLFVKSRVLTSNFSLLQQPWYLAISLSDEPLHLTSINPFSEPSPLTSITPFSESSHSTSLNPVSEPSPLISIDCRIDCARWLLQHVPELATRLASFNQPFQ